MIEPAFLTVPKADWKVLRALGVQSPFDPFDEWLTTECIDSEVMRLLRGVRLNQPGWTEAPIVLWRIVLLADVVDMSRNNVIKAVADSLSLRMFTRLGFEQAPPSYILIDSFTRQKQGELKEAVEMVSRCWSRCDEAKKGRGRRAVWKCMLDNWAERLLRNADKPIRLLQFN